MSFSSNPLPSNETFNYSDYRRNKGDYSSKSSAADASTEAGTSRPPGRDVHGVAESPMPFNRRRLRRQEFRSMVRRERVHNQIDKATKENVATDAIHSYERYAERPLFFISNRMYSAYRRSLGSRNPQPSGNSSNNTAATTSASRQSNQLYLPDTRRSALPPSQAFAEQSSLYSPRNRRLALSPSQAFAEQSNFYSPRNRRLALPPSQAFAGQNNINSRYRIVNRMKLAKGKIQSKIAKNGGKTVGGIIGNAVKSLAIKNPAVFVIIGGLFLILAYFNMMSGMVITVITSFTADEETASGVVEYLQELDASLANKIENIVDGYNDIDEVDINFGGVIATNPTHIMAYLTVKYNDFTLRQVRDDLKEIHQTLYTVEQKVETQIREKTESYTEIDPVTGEEYSGEHEVEYEYKILHITVTCRQFSDYIAELIDPGDIEWYELLVETAGNMMLGGNLGNPFVGVDWRSFVTTPYGHRLNPVDKRSEFHPAIDISWGGINGTPINAVHDGIVIRAVNGDSTYGNYIMLEDAEQNLRTRYSHCSSFFVSVGQEIKRGDEIARVGSTGKSTGPHLDIEVYRNGQHVNPITELSFN